MAEAITKAAKEEDMPTALVDSKQLMEKITEAFRLSA